MSLQRKVGDVCSPARRQRMPAGAKGALDAIEIVATSTSAASCLLLVPLMKCHMLPVTVASRYDRRAPAPTIHSLCNSCQVGRSGRRLHVSPNDNAIAIPGTQLVLIADGFCYTEKNLRDFLQTKSKRKRFFSIMSKNKYLHSLLLNN